MNERTTRRLELKLFLILIFFILLRCTPEKDKETEEEKKEEKIDIFAPENIVSCKYTKPIRVFGNKSCSLLFCRSSVVECVLKTGDVRSTGIVCPAIKDSNGSVSCPKAYECIISDTPGYEEAKKEAQKGPDDDPGNITAYSWNNECPGARVIPFKEIQEE